MNDHDYIFNRDNNIVVEVADSECTRMIAEAYRVEGLSHKLIEKMKTGIAEFWYIKRDGTTRHAFGTRLPDLVKLHVNGGKGPGHINFWDVEIAAWRSVDPKTLIWVK